MAYVVPPPVPGPVHEFAVRAEAAGVRRLVLLSGRGADGWGDSAFGQHMRSAEEAVRGSSLGWTVLRASNFAQNFDEDVFHAPLVAGALALPAGEVPEPFIDVEDLADAAVAVMTEGDRHAGRVYELSGPRSLSRGRSALAEWQAAGVWSELQWYCWTGRGRRTARTSPVPRSIPRMCRPSGGEAAQKSVRVRLTAHGRARNTMC
ncbi:hypothetical protein SMALA_4950 [Streptomyces malaysiensis subsp. malaysiensis]|nr:hypothetical protein SMALA_4950 [Streptomyces malaysiensis]